MISFNTRKLPIVSYSQGLGKAQGGTFIIAGTLLYAGFYGTFNSSNCDQIEAGSTVGAIFQRCRQVVRDQMAQCYNRRHIFAVVIWSNPITNGSMQTLLQIHSLNAINC